MAALACVLCFCELTKSSNRNLVENKGEFSVKRELEDLHFVVHPTSQHICRACFRSLQQRRNHQNKVDDLNNKLLRQYREKAGQKGLAIKTKLTAKRSLSFNQSNDSSAPFSECGKSEHGQRNRQLPYRNRTFPTNVDFDSVFDKPTATWSGEPVNSSYYCVRHCSVEKQNKFSDFAPWPSIYR